MERSATSISRIGEVQAKNGKLFMNILVAGFQHETNTFAPTMATYDSFVRGEDFPGMVRGQSVRELLQVNIPISGLIRHVEALGHTVTPVIWAGAGASAHVAAQAYEQIAGEIVEAVRTAAFDAIYLDLHGAMSRSISTTERANCEACPRRGRPGHEDSVSVDSHANMTAEMFALANVIAAYRTYPHVDMADTGRRAAEMLLHVVDTKAVVHFAVARLPFLIPVNAMSTMMHPARGVYDALEALEKDVLLLSFAPGFPASDFSQCGSHRLGLWPRPEEVGACRGSLVFKNTGGRAGMVGGIRRAICSSAAGDTDLREISQAGHPLPIRRTIPA